MKQVVIIGGGITGLSAAYQLEKSARGAGKAVAVTLLESSGRLGGKIVTEKIGGLAVEGGPDSFLTLKPWALELCRELGIEKELVGTNPRGSALYVYTRGKLRAFPQGMSGTVPTKLWPFLCSGLITWPGKLRMARDLWIARGGQVDESLGDFIERRLGREALDVLVEPVLAGIYAGNAREMSLQSTFPELLGLEKKYGSLIRGLRSQTPRANHLPPGTTAFMTFKNGMETLVEKIREKLPQTTLCLGQTVRRVSRSQSPGQEFEVMSDDGAPLKADAVVLTSSAEAAAGMLAGLNGRLAELLQEIAYASTATVTLAFRREDIRRPLNGFGFVVPRKENLAVTACTWSSSKFPDKYPADSVVLRCFVGGAGRERHAGLPEPELVKTVLEELAPMTGIRAEPHTVKVFHWKRANPQYSVGHAARLQAIDAELLKCPGLFLAGAAYRGVGLPDCVRQGRQAAQAALRHLSIDASPA